MNLFSCVSRQNDDRRKRKNKKHHVVPNSKKKIDKSIKYQIDGKNDQRFERENNNTNKDIQIRELHGQLEQVKNEKHNLQKINADKDIKIRELHGQLEQAEEQNKINLNKSREIDKLRKANKIYITVIKKLKEDASKNVAKRPHEATVIEIDIPNAKPKEKDIALTQMSITNDNNEIHRKNIKFEKLNENLDCFKPKVSSNHLASKVSELEITNNEKQSFINRQETIIKDLNIKLNENNKRQKEMEKEIEHFSQENKDLKSTLSNEYEYRKNMKNCQSLEISRNQKIIDDLTLKLNELEAKMTELINDRLTNYLEDYNNELNDVYQRFIQNYHNKYRLLLFDIFKKQNQRDNLESKLDQISQETMQSTRINDEIRKKLNINRKKLKNDLKSILRPRTYSLKYVFKEIGSPIGLQNPSALCFFNSVIQATRSCIDLTKHLLEIDLPSSETACGKYINLLKAMKKGDQREINEILTKFHQDYANGPAGDDVHQFYLKLFGDIHKDLIELSISSSLDFENEKMKRLKNRNNSIIFDYMNGIMEYRTCCTVCKFVIRIQFQTFKSIVLFLQDNIEIETFEDCWTRNFTPNKIDVDEIESCECPDGTLDIESYQSIVHSPKYLIIYLNRGSYYSNGSKKNVHVTLAKKKFQLKVGNCNEVYKLTCVIDHMGDSNSGHYYCKSAFQTSVEDWWLFSDNSPFVRIKNPINENSSLLIFYKA